MAFSQILDVEDENCFETWKSLSSQQWYISSYWNEKRSHVVDNGERVKLVDFVCAVWTLATNKGAMNHVTLLQDIILKYIRYSTTCSLIAPFVGDSQLKQPLQYGLYQLRRYLECNMSMMKLPTLSEIACLSVSPADCDDFVDLYNFTFQYTLTNDNQVDSLKSIILYDYLTSNRKQTSHSTNIMRLLKQELTLTGKSPAWCLSNIDNNGEIRHYYSLYLTTISWIKMLRKVDRYSEMFLVALQSLLIDESSFQQQSLSPIRIIFLLKLFFAVNENLLFHPEKLNSFLIWVENQLQSSAKMKCHVDSLWNSWNGNEFLLSDVESPITNSTFILYLWLELLFLQANTAELKGKVLSLLHNQMNIYENYFLFNQFLWLIVKVPIISAGEPCPNFHHNLPEKFYKLNWIYEFDNFAADSTARMCSKYILERFSVVVVPTFSPLLHQNTSPIVTGNADVSHVFPVHFICSKIISFSCHIYDDKRFDSSKHSTLIDQNVQVMLSLWANFIKLRILETNEPSNLDTLRRSAFSLSVEYQPLFNDISFSEWKKKHAGNSFLSSGRLSPVFPTDDDETDQENESTDRENQCKKSVSVIDEPILMWRWPSNASSLIWKELWNGNNEVQFSTFSAPTLLQLCWERVLVVIFYVTELEVGGSLNSNASKFLKLSRILAQIYTCRLLLHDLHLILTQNQRRKKVSSLSTNADTNSETGKTINLMLAEQQYYLISGIINRNLLGIESSVWDDALIAMFPCRTIVEQECNKFPILLLTTGGMMLFINYLQYHMEFYGNHGNFMVESNQEMPTYLQGSSFSRLLVILLQDHSNINIKSIPNSTLCWTKWLLEKSVEVQLQICDFIGCLPVLLTLVTILRTQEEKWPEIFEFLERFSFSKNENCNLFFDDEEDLIVNEKCEEDCNIINGSIWQCVGGILGKDDLKTLILILFGVLLSLLNDINKTSQCEEMKIIFHKISRKLWKNYQLASIIQKTFFVQDRSRDTMFPSSVNMHNNLFLGNISDNNLNELSNNDIITSILFSMLSIQHDSKILMSGLNVVEALTRSHFFGNTIQLKCMSRLNQFSWHLLQTVFTESFPLPLKSFCLRELSNISKFDFQSDTKAFVNPGNAVSCSVCSSIIPFQTDANYFNRIMNLVPPYEANRNSLQSIQIDFQELINCFFFPSVSDSDSVVTTAININKFDNETSSEWCFIRSMWLFWWRSMLVFNFEDTANHICSGLGYIIYNIVHHFQMKQLKPDLFGSLTNSPSKLSPLHSTNSSARNSKVNTPTTSMHGKTIGGAGSQHKLLSPQEFFAAKGAMNIDGQGKNPFSALLSTPESIIKSNHVRKQNAHNNEGNRKPKSTSENGISETVAAALPDIKRVVKMNLGTYTTATMDWHLQIAMTLFPLTLWHTLCSSHEQENNSLKTNFISSVKAMIWVVHQFSSLLQSLTTIQQLNSSSKRARKTSSASPRRSKNHLSVPIVDELSEFFKNHALLMLQSIDISLKILEVLQDTWSIIYELQGMEKSSQSIKEEKQFVLHWLMALVIAIQCFVENMNTFVEDYFALNNSSHARYQTMTMNQSILRSIRKRVEALTEVIESFASMKYTRNRTTWVSEKQGGDTKHQEPSSMIVDDDCDTDAEVGDQQSNTQSNTDVSVRLNYLYANELSESCKLLLWLDGYETVTTTMVVTKQTKILTSQNKIHCDDIPTDVE